jgi:hypothetical protein
MMLLEMGISCSGEVRRSQISQLVFLSRRRSAKETLNISEILAVPVYEGR